MIQEVIDAIEKWLARELIDDVDQDKKIQEAFADLPDDQQDAHLHYFHCRVQGTSPKLAEMFAEGRPPLSKTDVEFLRKAGIGKQFSESPRDNALGDYYKKVAESEGQDTTGKVYLSTIATHPGDARAWVSGRSDVARVMEDRDIGGQVGGMKVIPPLYAKEDSQG